ncbi:MAG: cation-transporting P-type ATPase [Gammaproteobacteria bacterium]
MNDIPVAPAATPCWHDHTAQFALDELISTPAGLAPVEVATRLARHGENRLPAAPRRAPLLRFLMHFHNVLIYVLLGSAMITMLLGHLADTLVILAVVVANAVIGHLQEGKAEKAMDSIRSMLAPHAGVIRDGVRQTIDGHLLVPGDIVLLEAGDKVPADLRLLSARGLRIQEAILTGESLPVDKHADPVPTGAALGDRACLAFSGTLVAGGQGRGVVVATGRATEIGRISGLLSEVRTLTTPLVRQMDVFAKWLTGLILLCAAVLLAFGHFVADYPFDEIFMVVVGLSVAAIPEGLPAVLTITLAVGVHAMARRNAVVRRLPAIETLGSVSVICTDKTGTLTRNEMLVAAAIVHDAHYVVGGSGYAPVGDIRHEGGSTADAGHARLAELGRAAALCNDAGLHEHEGQWAVAGDPMEGALLAFAAKTGAGGIDQHCGWTRTDAIPFDSQHRFMATLHHDHQEHAFVFVKGAPERILSMCISQRGADGGAEPLREAWWRMQVDTFAAKGQRVLALASRAIDPRHAVLEFADIEDKLVLLGLVGMIDPPRPEAIAAVAECHDAGIRVKMITGDHARTAMEIGRQIGLRNCARVLTGAEIDAMDDPALASMVLDTDIYARTNPEHKLRLVMALQAHAMTVAMTGDGVNDAPALRRADAGIAMGRGGSEAAKEAAEIVLVDDNFASIVAAVREGRTVYDNITKVIGWTLPTNAGEAMTIVAALLMGMALPVTPIQILWVNLITAVTLGLALAFEPTERDTMRRAPRRRTQPLLTGTLMWHIVLVAVLFICGVFGAYTYGVERGYSPELSRTLALNTLVVMEIFHLFFIRNIHGTSMTWTAVRGTRVVWSTVAMVTAAQFAVTYLPALQALFGTRAVPLVDGMLIVGIGVALLAIVEIEKQLRLRLRGATAGRVPSDR